MRKILAPVAITAAIAGGAGAVAFVPGFATAQDAGTAAGSDSVTTEASEERQGPLEEAIAGLVQDGTLTQEQAHKVLATLRQALPRHPKMRHFVHLELDAAADYLGMQIGEVKRALQDGRTLASLVDGDETVDGLVDAMVAAAVERIDQAVADGRVEEDRAAEIKERLEERITTFVNDGRPARPAGALRRHRHLGPWPGEAAPAL